MATGTQVFDIDEIICGICTYCDRQTLSRLARTKKTFTEPALNELWKTLSSFAHLLKLLPEEIVGWRENVYGVQSPIMKHLITPRDWSRFTLYAHRVKIWQGDDLSYIDEPVVDHIAFGRLPAYILPRITHMEMTGANVAGIHLQTLLASPSLESVSITNPHPTPDTTWAMKTFLRTVADRVPNLKSLTILWGGAANPTTFDPVRAGLVDLYTGIPNLQKLHLNSPGCINAQSFALIARLPSLNTLHLNLLGVTDIQELCGRISDASSVFPALQNVFLAGSIPNFKKILPLYGKQRMASIGLSVREFPKATALRDLFESLVAQFSSSLRILQFQVPKDEVDTAQATRQYMSTPDVYQINMTALEPLLTLRELVAVHLELGIPIQLNDQDLQKIGESWPKIEILQLCSDPYCERTRALRPVSTIHGLFSIIELCPRLAHLGLYLDYSFFLDDELLLHNRTLSTSVHHLDVGRSWVTEPPRVASLLSGILPSLRTFQWSGMDNPDTWAELMPGHSPGWKQVFDLLPVFRFTRVNERTVRIGASGTVLQLLEGP